MRPPSLLLLCLLSFTALAAGQVAAPADASVPRKGFFRTALTPVHLLGEQGAASVAGVFAADELLEWQLYVPPECDANEPSGVIVYISPDDRGGPPGSWHDVLGERKLIWIGALNAGNDVPVARRMLLAMFAPMLLQRHYALDAQRIYLAGFSGGAKTSIRVAVLHPGIFRGGIFMSGGWHWGDDVPEQMAAVARLNYMFVSGTNDSALKEVRRAHKKFKDAGIGGAGMLVIGNHRHALPAASHFLRAVDHLDSRLTDKLAEQVGEE